MFTSIHFKALKDHLLTRNGEEEAALVVAGQNETSQRIALLAREVIPIPPGGFSHKGQITLTIDPEFMMPIVKRCRLDKFSLILAHSHPFQHYDTSFSSIDDRGERVLMPKLQERIPDRHHASLVMGQTSLDARIWMNGKDISEPIDLVRVVGERLEEIPVNQHSSMNAQIAETHHRQVLAIGKDAQSHIQQLRVAVVGVGGIGSQVFQLLCHLGVRHLAVIDYDVLEESNLSRIVGASHKDVGTPKVEVAKELAHRINASIDVKAINGSVYDLKIAMQLRDLDVIFCCTDTLTSRVVLNRIAFQYLIPVVDTGVDIQCGDIGKIRTAAGRIMTILPDRPCLECTGFIDSAALQEEAAMIESGKVPKHGYVKGASTRVPSVISLNAVVAGLAVTELIDLLSGLEVHKDPQTYKFYRITSGTVQLYRMQVEKRCTLCEEILAMGDRVRLPCRS